MIGSHDDAAKWFASGTSRAEDWSPHALLVAKQNSGQTVSVVIPARNEAGSVGGVVNRIRSALMEDIPLVDELIVVDSLSTDDTSAEALRHGATVWSVSDIQPHLGIQAGKGEAMWKSLFVSTGSLLVFIDADLTEWGPHFVTGLLGPLLSDPDVLLVKGFYDRLLALEGTEHNTEGGRVTELVARPLISARWPELACVVQPLAGEWAIRRRLFEDLPVPVGYGVEFATLLDTWQRHGLPAIAQVDLGRRGHRHQSVHDLAVMATEIICAADRRSLGEDQLTVRPELGQYDRASGQWRRRPVGSAERPPAASTPGYRSPHG
jgi:glucosyl-3-phosphoglycerate synthase